MKVSQEVYDYFVKKPIDPFVKVSAYERDLIVRTVNALIAETGIKPIQLRKSVEKMEDLFGYDRSLRNAIEKRLNHYKESLTNATDLLRDKTIQRLRKNPDKTAAGHFAALRDFLILDGRLHPSQTDESLSKFAPAFSLRDFLGHDAITEKEMLTLVGEKFFCADPGLVTFLTFRPWDKGIYLLDRYELELSEDVDRSSLEKAVKSLSQRLSKAKKSSFWLLSTSTGYLGFSLSFDSHCPSKVIVSSTSGKFKTKPLKSSFVLEETMATERVVYQCTQLSKVDDLSTTVSITKNNQETSYKSFSNIYLSKKFEFNTFCVYYKSNDSVDRFLDSTSYFRVTNDMKEKTYIERAALVYSGKTSSAPESRKQIISYIQQAIDRGEDVNVHIGSRGSTLMHSACYYCDLELIQALMKSPTINLLARNAKGDLPVDSYNEGAFYSMPPDMPDPVGRYVRFYTARQAKDRGILDEYARRRTGGLDEAIPMRSGSNGTPEVPAPI